MAEPLTMTCPLIRLTNNGRLSWSASVAAAERLSRSTTSFCTVITAQQTTADNRYGRNCQKTARPSWSADRTVRTRPASATTRDPPVSKAYSFNRPVPCRYHMGYRAAPTDSSTPTR